MEELLDEGFGQAQFQQGDVVEGTLVKVSRGAILVDVGAKSEGIVASGEMERLSDEDLGELREGNQALVYIISPEGREGNPILSLEKARIQHDWQVAEQKFEAGELFDATIKDFNKGGFIIGVGEVRGFLPLSQTEGVPRRDEEVSLRDWMRDMKGQEVWVKIIELDRRRNRLILSQRQAERARRRERKKELLQELAEGQTCAGKISSLCEFGAFVDLGGADGLIHLSELSWRRGVKPEDVVSVGDEVEVYVLNVDADRGRIGLSLKRLQEEPWTKAAERYFQGQIVQGTVTKVTNFGAFARLDEYIEGLIHISELSDRRVAHPREVVKSGDVLPLRVLRVDPSKRRIALSYRQVEDHEYEEFDWKAELSRIQVDEPEEEASGEPVEPALKEKGVGSEEATPGEEAELVPDGENGQPEGDSGEDSEEGSGELEEAAGEEAGVSPDGENGQPEEASGEDSEEESGETTEEAAGEEVELGLEEGGDESEEEAPLENQ